MWYGGGCASWVYICCSGGDCSWRLSLHNAWGSGCCLRYLRWCCGRYLGSMSSRTLMPLNSQLRRGFNSLKLLNSSDSRISHSRSHSGVASSACARHASLPSFASAPASLAVVAHARSTPVHVAHNSWSDTASLQGPKWRKRVKEEVSGTADGGRLQIAQGWCGHTFFRPRGS